VPTSFRVIDTGIRDGRANVAFDQAMIDLHRDGAIPNTLRFLGFPPTVLIGRHQVLSEEVDLAYCEHNNIGTARRITGGGAIYFDQGQLGWALTFHRKTLGVNSLENLTEKICSAAAAGLSRLGIDAKYRPRNDIEVDGRKISGTGGFFDGNALFYQGTVLVDLDPATMVAALRVPASKLGKRGLQSAAGRIVTLTELLGSGLPSLEDIKIALQEGFAEALNLEILPGLITAQEESAAREIFDAEVGTDEFVHEIGKPSLGKNVYVGSSSGKGGTITCYLRLEGPAQNRIRDVLLTGDFFVTPPRVTLDLEATLKGIEALDMAATVESFFATSDIGTLSVTPQDFISALDEALVEARG
jgi:lipoate-protein ligase A